MAFNPSEGEKSGASAEEIMAILPITKNLAHGRLVKSIMKIKPQTHS